MNLVPSIFKRSRLPESYLRNRVDDLFDLISRDWPTLDEPFNTFKVDVKEADSEYVIKADLPGVDKNNINLNLANQILTISVEEEKEEEEKETNYLLKERTYRSCHRTIPLAFAGTQESVKADYKNGVLEVRVKKSPEKQSKRIPIA